MTGCKQQILNSIPSNSCCSHAFLAVVVDFCGFGQDFEVVCFDAEILIKLIYLSGQMNYNN